MKITLMNFGNGIATSNGRATILTKDHVLGDEINFERLELIASNEKNLLPISSNKMRESYNSGLAVVLRSDDGNDNGFVRLLPLLYSSKSKELGLPEDIGNIMEIGSAVVDVNLRGNHYSEDMLRVLIKHIDSHMNTLLLSTSKNARFISAIKRVSLEEGFKNYKIVSHNELPIIAPFTCTCTKPSGTGFGICNECKYRVQITDPAIKEYNRSDFGYFVHLGTKCFMYISDIMLANLMEQKISRHVRPLLRMENKLDAQQEVISRLKKALHY
jgi:hypothetical protein